MKVLWGIYLWSSFSKVFLKIFGKSSILTLYMKFKKSKRLISYTFKALRFRSNGLRWQHRFLSNTIRAACFCSLVIAFSLVQWVLTSGLTESRPGQVRFQDFWPHAFNLNRGSSAISSRPRRIFPHFGSFLLVSQSGYIISLFLRNFLTLPFKTLCLKYFVILLLQATTGSVLSKKFC